MNKRVDDQPVAEDFDGLQTDAWFVANGVAVDNDDVHAPGRVPNDAAV